MDLLEHPFEAVVFRLYSLPIPEAASAATGAAAAVLAAAAAAGLWRLRSSTPAAVVAGPTKPLELDPSPVAVAEVPSSPEPSRPSSSQRSPEPAAASTATTPKERYTAYFRDAGCVGCCDEDGDENEEEEDGDGLEAHGDDGDRDVLGSDGADPFVWEWEVVRSLRPLSPTAAAEMGRRRYPRSPTAALSVVQLWDQGGGGLTPTAEGPSSRRRRRLGLLNIQSPDPDEQ